MTTVPYLHFQGQCSDALSFYAVVFNGTDLQLLPYAGAPDAPADWRDSTRIMHAQLRIYDGMLMASDFPEGFAGDPQMAVSVMQSTPDVPEAQRVFQALCEGGAVIHPFGPSFFSPGFGMVKDKFGTHWIISADQPSA